ncbi:hypothetical protein QN277_004775 [Acacia crassicarpa]|uniref:Receptor-like serine/threonine-protein kinase n=1 Tax=Acacia crassicarpa TaxID=499986 RepID=A0AAE1JYS5_9FABA|nr:hypothetical protein QN277_004775 [Acacia crassicarpa]
MAPNFLFLCLFLSFLSLTHFSISQNTVSSTSFNASDSPWLPNQNRILLSPNSNFSAGFFPISSDRYTFSVWFTNVPLKDDPVVWSANSGSSVTGSASIVISSKGELLLNNSLLANASSTSNSASPVLSLSDDGNLSFGDWNSFDDPTDIVLPNQNISAIKLLSRDKRFRFVDSRSLSFNSSSDYYYATPSPLESMDSLGKVNMTNGAFLTSDYGENRPRKMVLGNDGNLKIYSFIPDQKPQWVEVWLAIWEPCKIQGKCGPSAICLPSTGINDSTSCVCPPGFKQNQGGPQQGCVRKTELTNSIKFLKLDYVNYTGSNVESMDARNFSARNFSICESKCKENSQCLGFGYKYDGSGFCSMVLGELRYGYWSPGTEASLFLKVDRSETDASNFTGMTEVMQTSCPVRISLPLPPKDSNSTARNIAIICTLFAAELISGVAFFWSFIKRYIKYRDMATTLGLEFLPAGGPKRFSYAELKTATKDFSNLIGRGGFGDVYKGELPDHRVVAVKCLKNVTGGDREFWAEVTIIARMHHLNLVRLWGFCTEKGQRILVYEYIPGGSLDKYLFRRPRAGSKKGEAHPDSDPKTAQKPILDWNIRYRIALGVARSIAYLHEECLEWVLHCDIKPENILLGDDFCPKISDFGLAKLRKKEDMVTMSRRRGTPGYMAPEWITTDPITSKADVYSFGMVLLELVSGVRNFEIQGSLLNSEEWYFPGWAFDKMFKEMKPEDILDCEIKQLYDSRAHFNMINRMVKTAMWCLQDRPELRPTMGKVAKMLEGTVEISEPKKPTVFFLGGE